MTRLWLPALTLFGLAATVAADAPKARTLGTIEKKAPEFDALVGPDAKIEVLVGSTFRWSEGPVWLPDDNSLLFSDIPRNIVWRWREGVGIEKYLEPAGYTGKEPFGGGEPGSNGLALDKEGRLLLCMHGDRKVARREKDGSYTDIATAYEGKRFNSPNDLHVAKNGDVYFTDPPYGLPKGMDGPNKELPYQGVYRWSAKDNKVTLLTKEMSRPNGIALSPDEKTLYVANSDLTKAVWMAFPVKEDGTVGAGKVLFDATPMVGLKNPGAPDGMKVDKAGNLFATGPGGVLVISPEGKHLGTLRTGVPTANCGWGGDGSTLYITANDNLVRVRTKTSAAK